MKDFSHAIAQIQKNDAAGMAPNPISEQLNEKAQIRTRKGKKADGNAWSYRTPDQVWDIRVPDWGKSGGGEAALFMSPPDKYDSPGLYITLEDDDMTFEINAYIEGTMTASKANSLVIALMNKLVDKVTRAIVSGEDPEYAADAVIRQSEWQDA